MFKLFTMLVERFAKFFDFLNKYINVQNIETAFKASRFVSRKGLLVILVALTLSYFTLLIAFTYFTFEAVTTTYNMISTLLHTIESSGGSGSSSPIVSTTFYLLHVSGFATGFSAAFPFVASALTYRLLKPVKEVFLRLYRAFLYTATDLIKIVTAA